MRLEPLSARPFVFGGLAAKEPTVMVAYWSEGQEPQLAAEHSLELYFTEHPIIGWINWAAACLVEPLGFMFWAAWAVLIIGYFWAGTSSG